jgi:hypothetical protein
MMMSEHKSYVEWVWDAYKLHTGDKKFRLLHNVGLKKMMGVLEAFLLLLTNM